MYVPPKFNVDDLDTIHSFIKDHPFGLLLSLESEEIHDTHTPFHLRADGALVGHIAKANPQWKSWTHTSKVKVIFSGPHSYISPKYYSSDFNVPTWNYSAVSITGTIKVIDSEEEMLDFLDSLTNDHEDEKEPWTLDRNDERYMKLLSGIVVFEITPTDIKASFKMSQNKSEEDKANVIDSLNSSGCPFDHQTAEFISQTSSLPNDGKDQQ
eukprot:Seg18947.1 transcript_id=Seg18947.1/GoldUCD/mRNA.D3Y31 product="Protease synthase and sporulation protein PAI 2" protein_id=Seg18947.1/GoldUCD/D3Y31